MDIVLCLWCEEEYIVQAGIQTKWRVSIYNFKIEVLDGNHRITLRVFLWSFFFYNIL